VERPILLAVDEELGERPRLGFPQDSPIRWARSKWEYKDVEELGAGSRAAALTCGRFEPKR
jgi:hypothetical protein